uniref:Flavin prenyltransferase UbiX n=1 Tax=Candidatus Kentrum sp. FM TaxID=2126340 RepID=A0A450TWK5_9GAMM|nr:MAG: 4-hydroxy-3-polyprenylbenzoate decarboxylase [Candidatus Kentron sp. FM]VFJ73456.1 MAG: 4-hydroxy-3-polyprenylbenzoate decarboxylase [Candidatus Kentron sp. FM]VFK20430.1 MAG: 4-hydroxy-3-polyprenylbenzoate decarboxylase [Candidatus Kentron sp. FM]
MNNHTIGLAITGASGAAYGLRLLEVLLDAGESVSLLVSGPGRIVMALETGVTLPEDPRDILDILTQRHGSGPGQLTVFGLDEWTAPIASGSNAPRAFVICPCSGATLAAIASGASRDLLERAADVVLKERRQLILVPREMPLSAIHLENMLKLANLGAVIMPASPGFYHRPQTIGEVVDFVVARILDHLGVEYDLAPRWG